jgi:translation initiation factor IF-3
MEVTNISEKTERDVQVNEEIRAREVRVISDTGEQLGIMLLDNALRLAAEKGLDLVRVAAEARPPVCKMMDYGRFKYEQSKRDREARKNQKVITIKEIQLRPFIEEHDMETKARNARRFLEEGDRLRVVVRFRGRELSHTSIADEVLAAFLAKIADVATVEKPAKVEGRNMVLLLMPKGS